MALNKTHLFLVETVEIRSLPAVLVAFPWAYALLEFLAHQFSYFASVSSFSLMSIRGP